jgi:energy-coupling factor transport system ATP-binding protein
MALVCSGLTVAPAGVAAPILRDVSLRVCPGQVLGLAGASGSGKSTLLSALMKYNWDNKTVGYCPTSGVEGAEGVTGPAAAEARAQVTPSATPAAVTADGLVARVMQRPERQLFAQTAFEDVTFGPLNMGATPVQAEQAAADALAAVGLDAARARTRSPFAYSGGQRRRLAIAGALAMRPAYLLLDEPTAGLDARQISQLTALIRRLASGEALGRPVGIIVSSHNTEFLWEAAPQICVLRAGQVAYAGQTSNLMANVSLAESLALEPHPYARALARLASAGAPVPPGAWATPNAALTHLKTLIGTITPQVIVPVQPKNTPSEQQNGTIRP